MKKILGWTVAAVVSLGGVAACNSDSKSSSTTKATTTAGGGNAAVDEFCKQADDLAGKLKAVLADPTSADAGAVTASATKLSTDAAALISANPSETAQINACVKKLTDATSGG